MTSHEIPYREQKTSTTLYVTSALDGESVINATPYIFIPGMRPDTHCGGDCSEPSACLYECGKHRSHRNSFTGQSTIPTELPRHMLNLHDPRFLFYLLSFC